MSRRILFFQSKVALAIIGTLLIGSGAAYIAAASFSATPNQASTNQSQNYVNVSTNEDDTPSSATSTPGTKSSSTPTPGKSPTPTPRPPTPTPTPRSGQAGTIRGTVTSVDTAANQFTVRVFGGALKTVFVNAQTTFQGACTSLSGMHTGWSVEVQGVYQGSAFLAKDVNSDD